MTAWRTPALVASVKKLSKNRVRTAIPSASRCEVKAGSSSVSSMSPFIILMKASTPTALTNGSAKGSSIRGLGPLDAIARRAATAVAVAPTLDARSQLSPSWRPVSLAVIWRLLSASCDDGDDVSECGQCVVVGEDPTVFTEELAATAGGHVPAAVGEIVRDVVSLPLVEQPGQVDIAADVGPSVTHRLAALGHRRTAVRVKLGGDLTARGAERRNVVEQPVLRFRWQVHQQPLGAPGRRFGVVKTAVAQRCRPILAQIDADRAALCRRFGAQFCHGLGFEHHDLRLIDFVDDATGR